MRPQCSPTVGQKSAHQSTPPSVSSDKNESDPHYWCSANPWAMFSECNPLVGTHCTDSSLWEMWILGDLGREAGSEIFFSNSYLLIRKRDEEREYVKEKESSSIFRFTLQMFTTAKAGPGLCQELETQSRCPIWVDGTQILESSSAASQRMN